MPIVYDAGSSGGNNSVSSLSVNHTIGASGYGRMLVVGLITHCSTPIFVNYVRYNGVSMNYLQFRTANSGLLLSQIWCMPDANLPAAGTYAITAGFDTTIDRGCMLFGTSWYGMAQSNPSPNLTAFGDAVTTLQVTYRPRASLSRTIEVVATSLQQTPSATGSNNQSIVSGNQASSIGGGQYRYALQGVVEETFGVNVASSSSIAMCYSEFLPADWPAVTRDRVFGFGINKGFNRGFDRL